jgi:protein-tyrosine phosphatase
MPSILFVCTANRFRSPLAAAIFQRSLEERGIAESWQVGSAGTWTIPGKPVIPAASVAARKLGLDLSTHRSAEVSGSLLSKYDLILVMQAGQKEALLTEFPTSSESIHLLSEVVEERSYDIPDERSIEGAVQIAYELDGLIRIGLDQICDLAKQRNDTRSQTEFQNE